MFLIDRAFFINGDLKMPNMNESLDVMGGNDSIEWWIDKEARLCLQNALGNVLFTELTENMSNGELNSDALEKWSNLVNGTSYLHEDVTYTWKGLVSYNGLYEESLIAYYVFSKWLDATRVKLTGLGEATSSSANAKSFMSRRKYIETYNKFIDLYQGDTCNGYVSLLTFLSESGNYTGASLNKYYYENQMGI